MVNNAAKESRSDATSGTPKVAAEEWPFADDAALGGLDDALGEEAVTLALADLIQDSNGEIVLFNDSNLRRLALVTGAAELARGQAPHHVTAAGEDVTGFAYVTFDNGITLYYEPQLDLVIRPAGG